MSEAASSLSSSDRNDASPDAPGSESGSGTDGASGEAASAADLSEHSPSEATGAGEVEASGEADPEADTGAFSEREGIVTRSTGSWYDVQVGDETIPSRVRGKFRLQQEENDVTNPVAVGDRVTLRVSEDDQTGFIVDIHERENKLSRRAAGRRAGQEHVIVSNIDAAWAVQAVRMPKLNPGFIDRFLVATELFEVPAGIIMNKVDLLTDDEAEEVRELEQMYEDLGYPVLRTCAIQGDGLQALKDELADRVNVIAGPSGAGKSSLLNAIEPGLDVETGEVSDKTQKGRHTTTFAELHPLSFGGYVVDTPGIREFGMLEIHPADLAHFFVEFIDYLDDCKFQDCTHDHEPGCAVKEAVDEGEIHWRRYESYLNILYSLQEGGEGMGR